MPRGGAALRGRWLPLGLVVGEEGPGVTQRREAWESMSWAVGLTGEVPLLACLSVGWLVGREVGCLGGFQAAPGWVPHLLPVLPTGPPLLQAQTGHFMLLSPAGPVHLSPGC